MNIINFDVGSGNSLVIGRQYDHKVNHINFTGFTPISTDHTVYLKIDGKGLYPLFELGFDVSQSFTLKRGTMTAQLVEVANDESVIQNSKLFDLKILESLDENTEIIEEDPSLDLWFNEMSSLYNTIKAKLENGEFSVDIESIEESEEDGGVNIVKFTDGKAVEIRNGRRGQRGEQGIPGLVIPTGGMFSMFINDDGELVIAYNEADKPPSLYIDENGCLIFGEKGE